MGSISLIPFVACLLLLSSAATAQIGLADRHPAGLTVSGTSEVRADPDVAHVSLGVQTRAAQAAAAAQENAQRTAAVIAALRNAGIAERDIETTRYSVQPVYDYRQLPAALLAYEVSNIVRTTVRDLPNMGAIIDAAIAAGANRVEGVSFGLENDEPVRRQALVEAINNAQAKAQTMAETLNIRLGPVIYASDVSPPVTIPMPRVAIAEARMPDTPIMPQEITIQGNVQVTYGIIN